MLGENEYLLVYVLIKHCLLAIVSRLSNRHSYWVQIHNVSCQLLNRLWKCCRKQ